MKRFLVLSVLVLAAMGAPGPRSAASYHPGSGPGGQLLPLTEYLWLDSITGPPDTVYGDTTVLFRAMLRSALPDPTFVEVEVSIGGYVDKAGYVVPVGGSVAVDLWVVLDESMYAQRLVIRDSIMDSMPTDSSVVTWRLGPRPGSVEEGHGRQVASTVLPPTVLHHLPTGAIAFDPMGRRVLQPQPGIYFLRTEAAAAPRKVLLVE